MEVGKVQAIISIGLVGAFVIGMLVIGVYPILAGYPADTFAELLKVYGSIYSGVVGIILGYFFGKGQARA